MSESERARHDIVAELKAVQLIVTAATDERDRLASELATFDEVTAQVEGQATGDAPEKAAPPKVIQLGPTAEKAAATPPAAKPAKKVPVWRYDREPAGRRF